MAITIGRRQRGTSTLRSTGVANVQLEPTVKGAWKVQYSYIAFGSTEYQRGPAGLGPFVAAQLFWAGVNTSEQAQVVRYLADPGEIEGDAGAIASVDHETLAALVDGNLGTARLGNPNDKDQVLALYNQLPQNRGEKFGWREWFDQARQIAVIYTPRGFTIPEDDPLYRAYGFTGTPVTDPDPVNEEIPR